MGLPAHLLTLYIIGCDQYINGYCSVKRREGMYGGSPGRVRQGLALGHQQQA